MRAAIGNNEYMWIVYRYLLSHIKLGFIWEDIKISIIFILKMRLKREQKVKANKQYHWIQTL